MHRASIYEISSIAMALDTMVHCFIQLYETCYKGPVSSLVGIEFWLLNSPFSVKPGERVELRTYANVSRIFVSWKE